MRSKNNNYRSSYLLSGHTAETINRHEEFVLGLWEELKRKTSRKKCKLNDASEFHKLNNEVRTLCLASFFSLSSF